MKFKEIKELDPAELDKKIDEVRMELMKLNAQVATGTSPKNPNQVRLLKKTIAKILTIKQMRRISNQVEKTEVDTKKNE